MTLRDDATERQVQAAQPDASTWVTANAGSGKTRVLTDRVARLLLRGVQPQHILCLTYTKAAATEMQNRLFRRLGEWAMRPDRLLRSELEALGEQDFTDRETLAKARRLFARALETPGGLRIQTIHSFCATLLRRFPLEAGVSPGFKELDDRAARLLRAQIIEEMALAHGGDVMTDIARIYTGDDFTKMMEQVANNRAGFSQALSEAEAKARFGVPPDERDAAILADTFLGNEANLIAELLPLLARGGKTDLSAAARLATLDMKDPKLANLSMLEAVFLFGSTAKEPFSAKIGSFPTKDLQAAFAHRMDQLNAFMLRVESARERRLGLEAARKTHVLHQFARSFLPLYARAKEVRGWLDFDDLIARAKALLTDRSVAAWVLYRLDGGIDHILVDEAQDTSPDQWKVIELLSAEFTAGQGAQGDKQRTLFVVGDKKQSIYSFQGADVTAFDEKHALFKTGFKRVGQQFQSLDLSYSFRSAPVILNLVDAAFARHFQPALGDSIQHFAFKAALPGRVDLWPLIEPVKSEKNDEWENPVDLISDTHHTAKLAAGIAREIKVLIDSGTQLRDENGVDRAVHAGDFLILVQRRSALFAEVIAACKKAGLAIAGADRLKLGAELAVKDLAALLAFLATPEDDLSLAALLRSPLCGWTEDELYQLAQGRKGYLWESLRNHEAHVETRLMLNDLRAQADFLRPFDLLERALTRHDGRRRLLARLGDEAEDGIDELLSQAFSYETNDVPSLTGFLIWLETDDVIVKRQVDSAGKRIRVMTVHGAKGLEAPIVILPDTCDRSPQDRDEIYRTDDGFPIWKTPSEASPITVSEIRVQRKFQANAESARLLYVALTRARSWLIVAGAGEAKTEVKNAPKPVAEWCWYRIVESGMRALGALPYEHGRLRLSNGNWPTNQPPEKQVETAAQPVPEWALLAAKPVAHPASAVSPSNLGGAKVLPAEDDALSGDLAKARGTALHRLLEHLPMLPRKDWPAVATLLVPDASLCAELYFEAVCALDNPDLAWVFGPDTMAEVPFTAALGAGLVEGKLDRLQVAPDCVRLVDFKSNAVVPPNAEMVPEGLLRQMGAYAAAFGQIYPDRRIETFILWTRTATLMPLDADIVSAALLRATIP